MRFLPFILTYFGVLAAFLPFMHWRNSKRCFRCDTVDCPVGGFVALSPRPYSGIRLQAKECVMVRENFKSRMGSAALQGKLGRADHWHLAMVGCHYCLIKPGFPFRVGGFADKFNAATSHLIVGYEGWLSFWFLTPWRNSALDHELTHCRQQYELKLISKLWEPGLTRREYWAIWARAEFEAAKNSGLWTGTVLAIFVLPFAIRAVLACVK